MKTIKFLCYSIALASGAVSMTSCGSDDGGGSASLPPIGGYNSADEVGAADLVAYWPLNGTGVESKSNTAPNATVGTSYETGMKGQGAKFNAGFMKYPTIATLSSSLTSFSVSAWVKANNNGQSGSVFLSLSRPNEWAGSVNFISETGWMPATSDSITFKGQIVSSNALGWQDSRNAVKVSPEDALLGQVGFANKVGGQWAHAVIVWDGALRTFKVYSNGVKISNPTWEQRGTPNGDMLAFATPTYPVIGAFATTANGTPADTWDKGLTGSIDEMRVWKKALNAADIMALYELEKAGR